MWLGGNGSGIYLFDMRLSHMEGNPYTKNFHEDVLLDYLHVPPAELSQSFLSTIESYQFRWMEDKDGKLWLSKVMGQVSTQAQVCYYKDGHLVQPPWHYTNPIFKNTFVNITAVSQSGKLWGMDFYSRLVYFDTITHEVTVYPPVTKKIDLNYDYTVNSLLIDGENQFWFTTALNGLFQYDKASGKTIHYFNSNNSDGLPIKRAILMALFIKLNSL